MTRVHAGDCSPSLFTAGWRWSGWGAAAAAGTRCCCRGRARACARRTWSEILFPGRRTADPGRCEEAAPRAATRRSAARRRAAATARSPPGTRTWRATAARSGPAPSRSRCGGAARCGRTPARAGGTAAGTPGPSAAAATPAGTGGWPSVPPARVNIRILWGLRSRSHGRYKGSEDLVPLVDIRRLRIQFLWLI